MSEEQFSGSVRYLWCLKKAIWFSHITFIYYKVRDFRLSMGFLSSSLFFHTDVNTYFV